MANVISDMTERGDAAAEKKILDEGGYPALIKYKVARFVKKMQSCCK
eukprot:CAMPEP_0198145112 /NCGR_PEP_ID=MMETSP1443-20131203/21053_1 /TAXON_ID=186043 /ORGANISM="Entomoneis sp., Strain CCMP2396" /LENGTH=46 /DNA_ID= /DNA_START= /DNA_END= /DNA_ORIENTATION=